jgi:HD-GYP domain-containing protein (c-di-GMP phosphodiesterase class II)
MNQLAQLNDRVREFLTTLDAHNPGEAAHAHRVSVYAVATADRLDVRGDDLIHLKWAALLHDVGKVSVDARLMQKLGKLDEIELAALREHASAAESVIEGTLWLVPAAPMIRHHHEWWNGEGYPDGISGEAIPLGARIIGVAEAYDVLVSDVPWRNRLDEALALKELERCRGKQFDPAVLDAFRKIQPLVQPADAT